MRKTFLGLAVIAALATPLAMAGSAYAATALNNASFEDANVTFPAEGYYLVHPEQGDLTHWTVGGAGVDIVDKALWQAGEGSRSIDLNAFNPGSISQTITTVPGQTYNVTFAMSGNPDANVAPGPKTMNVTAAGTTLPFTYDTAVEQNNPADMKWKDQTFSFAANALETTLTFTSTTTTTGPSPAGVSAAAGPVIDNVAVTAAPNVVNKVWHTWTGGPVTSAPDTADAGWHPTSGDPQSKVHKFENNKVGVPYYVANNGNKGGGSWFLWLETTA